MQDTEKRERESEREIKRNRDERTREPTSLTGLIRGCVIRGSFLRLVLSSFFSFLSVLRELENTQGIIVATTRRGKEREGKEEGRAQVSLSRFRLRNLSLFFYSSLFEERETDLPYTGQETALCTCMWSPWRRKRGEKTRGMTLLDEFLWSLLNPFPVPSTGSSWRVSLVLPRKRFQFFLFSLSSVVFSVVSLRCCSRAVLFPLLLFAFLRASFSILSPTIPFGVFCCEWYVLWHSFSAYLCLFQ